VAERVLDVVAEDHQEEHVAEEMIPAEMDEHVGERRKQDRNRIGVRNVAAQDRRREAEGLHDPFLRLSGPSEVMKIATLSATRLQVTWVAALARTRSSKRRPWCLLQGGISRP
jgi:hypothetical protein